MSILHVTTDNFQSEVMESKETVLLDFHATWCGPCKALAPVLEEVDASGVELKICKIDVDQAPNLAKQYRVMSVPTLMVIKNGEVVERASGLQDKASIIEMTK